VWIYTSTPRHVMMRRLLKRRGNLSFYQTTRRRTTQYSEALISKISVAGHVRASCSAGFSAGTVCHGLTARRRVRKSLAHGDPPWAAPRPPLVRCAECKKGAIFRWNSALQSSGRKEGKHSVKKRTVCSRKFPARRFRVLQLISKQDKTVYVTI
jgi:hypothetical protein